MPRPALRRRVLPAAAAAGLPLATPGPLRAQEAAITAFAAASLTDAPRALIVPATRVSPLGIVRATDATASRGARVVGAFPAGSHPPVTCPFAPARRAGGSPQARAPLAFLAGSEAAGAWRRFGFSAERR